MIEKSIILLTQIFLAKLVWNVKLEFLLHGQPIQRLRGTEDTPSRIVTSSARGTFRVSTALFCIMIQV